MEIIPIKTRKITVKDSLVDVLQDALKKNNLTLQNGDIIAIVSKVVALTEGGLVDLSKIKLEKLIQKEADMIFDNADFSLTIKNGIFTPNAGIDQSNVPQGYALGWPRDAYKSAQELHKTLLVSSTHTQKNPPLKNHLKHLGILIFDSHIIPLRNGVTGIALGYAGFRGVEDYRGKRDLYKKPLRVTQKNLADGLASTATLVTGEGAESIPFVIIRGAPVKWVAGSAHAKISHTEMQRKPSECLYNAIYLKEIKK